MRNHGQGTRPVLVLSRAHVSDETGEAIVLPISSVEPRAGYPLSWQLPEGRLPLPSWILISRPTAQLVSRLREPVATLDREQMGEIVAGLRELIED
jgi:mRNA-degrading endonuclease toxin of MazEF toxin-antitoxin module